MSGFIEWLLQNKDWILSGIGVSLISVFFTWIFKRNKQSGVVSQKLSSSDYSNPMQAGRNIYNVSIEKNSGTHKITTTMLVAAIRKNAQIVEYLKEQYDKITKPSAHYSPKYFLDLYFLKNMINEKSEIFENLPSPEMTYEAISNLFVLEKHLETLRTTAEKELVKLGQERIYQYDIIVQFKEQLDFTHAALKKATDVLEKRKI